MKMILQPKFWLGLVVCLVSLAPVEASAQRNVHWQINPRGFPADTSVFADVEENGVFKRTLTAASFSVSVDEFAGDQGGWVVNQQPVQAGAPGAQVLIMIDKSRSYTGEFDKAKRVMKAIVNGMDPRRDTIAIATAPSEGGFSEAKLAMNFTADQASLLGTINRIQPLANGNNAGARICNALSEGLRWFPEQPSDKYRVIVFLTGGADKGEGRGDCVKDSYANGKVPFFPIVFKLDRKYDDPRNSHKIENKTHELAQETGGQSIFRRSETGYMQFVGILWNRIRSQYLLKVRFPCYRPMPVIEHTSVLKVEGRDVDGIRFQATSQPPPVPAISKIYPDPAQATRKQADDGAVKLTIDGSGFCGPPGTVKVYVGGGPVSPESQNPFRLVVPLNSAVGSGKIKVINRFGQSGESLVKFNIIKGGGGSEAGSTVTALVIGLVLLAVFAIVIVSMKARRAKGAPAAGAATANKPDHKAPSIGSSAKTMAMSSIARAWVVRKDGREIELNDGNNVIGREPTLEIPLDDVTGVSRNHAKIELNKSQGLIWVEDMGSTNGTYWGAPGATEDNLKLVDKKHLLNSGDTVWVSGEILVIRFDGGTTAPREG